MAKTDKHNYCIYCHINKINGKIYVGLSNNYTKRWGNNGNGYRGLKNKGSFSDAIKKYGWDNFEHIIIKNGLSYDEAKILEMLYIKELNSLVPNGYNLTLGGEGMNGFKHSKETKKILSEKHKGMISPRKGVVLSDEVKKKISKANSGKVLSEETKDKISKSLSERKLSDKTKTKLSNARKGIKFSKEHRRKLSNVTKRNINIGIGNIDKMAELNSKPVTQYDVFGNKLCEYKSISEASEWNDVAVSGISKVCKMKRKTAGGYIWRYVYE